MSPVQNTRTWKHNVAILSACFVVALVGVMLVLIFSPRNVASGPVGENATPVQYNPQNAPVTDLELPLVHLEGDWYMKEDDTAFAAKVEGNSIKIDMIGADGVTALYWHGTFKTSESPGNAIISEKTEGQDEIVISQSSTKDFRVGLNSITFKFSALGFSKDVELRR